MPRNLNRFLVILWPVVVAAQETGGQEPFQWKATTPLLEARAGACSVKLPDGRVLVAGGNSAGGPINSAELYKRDEGFAMAAYMTTPRAGHTCTLLTDGRVLAYGGGEAAETYDPVADRWERVETRGLPRRGHTATKTEFGDVIFAGGETGNGLTAELERWNQALGEMELLPYTLTAARKDHAATLLPDGRVLISGGANATGPIAGTEFLDTVAGAVQQGPELPRARMGHAAVLLYDGRVLVAAGTGSGGEELAEAEIYWPREGKFETLAARMKTPRRDPLVLFLEGNGSVLFAGGLSNANVTGSSELFQPVDDQFVEVGTLTIGRSALAGALMDGGTVLAVGGATANGLTGACGTLSSPTLKLSGETGQSGVFEGGSVKVEASNWGFFPKEWSLKRQDPTGSQSDVTFLLPFRLTSAPSITGGLFQVAPRAHGDRFFLNVRDLQTGATAQAFIDVTQPTVMGLGASAMVGSPFRLDTNLQAVRPPSVDISTISLGRIAVERGMLSATFADPRGRLTATRIVNTTTPLSVFDASIILCCPTTPGTYRATGSFLGSRTYEGSADERNIFVADNVPSFEMRNRDFTLGVSASSEPRLTSPRVDPQPSLAATATLSRGNGTPVSIPIGFGGSAPAATYTPTVAEIAGGICFTLRYPGNAAFKPLVDTQCYRVRPTPSSISISTASSTYIWGTSIDIPAIFNWTAPDARLLNATATLTAKSAGRTTTLGSVTLTQVSNTSATTAAGSSSWELPMAVTEIEITYSGSTDMAPATSSTRISMPPVPTNVTLDAPTLSARLVTLKANVLPAVRIRNFTAQPFYEGPSGSVQFFDGATLLGTVVIPANIESAPAATLTVSVAAGSRSFKAVFVPGNSRYAGAESAVRSLVVP